MPCRLKTLVVLLVLALMPLRVLADVTAGVCGVAHQVPSAAAADGGDTHGPLHQHAGARHSHGGAEHDHGEHCASVSFVIPTQAWPLAAPATAGGVAQRPCSATSFIADRPDPPPLAL